MTIEELIEKWDQRDYDPRIQEFVNDLIDLSKSMKEQHEKDVKAAAFKMLTDTNFDDLVGTEECGKMVDEYYAKNHGKNQKP